MAEKKYGKSVSDGLTNTMADLIAAENIEEFRQIHEVELGEKTFSIFVTSQTDLHGIPIYGIVKGESGNSKTDYSRINTLKMKEVRVRD